MTFYEQAHEAIDRIADICRTLGTPRDAAYEWRDGNIKVVVNDEFEYTHVYVNGIRYLSQGLTDSYLILGPYLDTILSHYPECQERQRIAGLMERDRERRRQLEMA